MRVHRRRSGRLVFTALVLAVVCCGTGADSAGPSQSKAKQSAVSEFNSRDLVAAQQVTSSLGVSEWLGPLAPVALSPFFAVTCLSGMSLYGGDWFAADNPFLDQGSPLNNELVFIVFLVLPVITSVPRLTKVSKPFVQATDQLEAWAGIITMLVLKFLVSGGDVQPDSQDVVLLGIVSGTVMCC